MDLEIRKAPSVPAKLDVLDAIYARRAVRAYTSQKVEEGLIGKLLNAAIQAPSARNLQPWAFSVIQSPQLLKDISEKTKQHLKRDSEGKPQAEHFSERFSDPNFNIFYGAPTVVVICAKRDGYGPIEDCYLAAENLMLAAVGMGLGTCPVGLSRDVLRTAEFRKKLGLPEDFVPVIAITVGYSKGVFPRPPKLAPVIFKWIN